jgi:hypothetical protein
MWPRITFPVTVILALFGLSSAPAQAGPIKYVVSQTVGTAQAIGFIETDGTIGSLSSRNVINWNLLLIEGGSTLDTADLSPANSNVFDNVGPLSATSSGLFFDFTSSGGHSFSFGGFVGSFGWYDGEIPSCICRPIIRLSFDHVLQLKGMLGWQLVAGDGALNTVGTLAIPEPGSLAPLAGGLLGLGAFARRSRG